MQDQMPCISSNNPDSERPKQFVATQSTVTGRKDKRIMFYTLIEQIPCAVIVTDIKGTIEYVNSQFTELTGYTREEVTGANPRILKSGRTAPEEYKHLWETITSGKKWKGVFCNKKKDGSFYWEKASISPLMNEEGMITHFFAIKEDITIQKQNEQRHEILYILSNILMESVSVDEAIPKILQTIGEGEIGRQIGVDRVCLVLSGTNNGMADNVYEWCNEGIPSQRRRFMDVSFFAFTWWMKHLRAGDVIHIPQVCRMPKEAAAEQEFLIKREVKSVLSFPVFADKDSFGFISCENILNGCSCKEQDIMLLRIVSEIIGNAIVRKRSEACIQHMAYHDALTNLPNRNLFRARLEMAILQAKRNKKMAAVMALDLDGFKAVNDSFGHHMGDLLLKEAAVRMKECVRECDTVARFGGDEFMVILTNINHREDANHVAKKLLGLLSQKFLINNDKIGITVSIGISLYPADGNDMEDLIKKADNALYCSKKEGKNTHR